MANFKEIVTKAVGEQLQRVVTDSINSQYPEVYGVVRNAVTDALKEK